MPLLYITEPLCVEFIIIDVYAMLVITPYVIYWVLGKRNRIALAVLAFLNFFSLESHITSLRYFDNMTSSEVGDCYRFHSPGDRYVILFLLLALLFGLPVWHYKFRNRNK
jgi:hypothetical protein